MMARLVSLLMLSLSLGAVAHDHHEHHNEQISETRFTYGSDGVSLSLAMVKDLQIGVGGGFYEDQYGNSQSGVAVGFGKRLCVSDKSCGIINFSAGINEGGGQGLNVGFTWKL
jgi:hypothetical protein